MGYYLNKDKTFTFNMNIHMNIQYEHEINERGLKLMWTDLEDTLLVAKDMVQKKVNIS